MYKDEGKKFDTRVVEKYIQDGLITPEQYKEYLESLPDVSSNVDQEYDLNFSSAHRKAEG